MPFSGSYHPEYEYDLLIHRRKMIAIYQTQIFIFNCILSARCLWWAPRIHRVAHIMVAVWPIIHIYEASKRAVSGNGFEPVIISRGFLGFLFTLGSSFYLLNILSYGYLLPDGLSYQLSCWTLVGPEYVRKMF